jgi:hypothetical protein
MELVSPLLAMGWLKFRGLSLDLYGNSKVGSLTTPADALGTCTNPQEIITFST